MGSLVCCVKQAVPHGVKPVEQTQVLQDNGDVERCVGRGQVFVHVVLEIDEGRCEFELVAIKQGHFVM